MSVFTTVSRHQLEQWLQAYELGALIDHRGITSGIVNTNYFVTTQEGEFVLTLFETLGKSELPYYLSLMAFFAERQLPSPHPQADRHGRYLNDLCGKPAALVQKLDGVSVLQPGERECREIGACLGRMHRAGLSFPERRVNPQGLAWRQNAAEKLLPLLDADDRRFLSTQLNRQSEFFNLQLPRGVIHGDLFRDNALFVANRLSGVLDYYFACDELLIYDLAISVIDWCMGEDAVINYAKARALTSAYGESRSVDEAERQVWPMILSAASLRWWLARLLDQYFPRDGAITQRKEPGIFKRRLQTFVAAESELQQMWS